MKKKIWIGAILLLTGIVLATITLCIVGFDLSKLDSHKFVTETVVWDKEPYDNLHILDIRIDADVSDIQFVQSDSFGYKVVSRHKEYMAFSAEIEGYTLVIREADQRVWYEYIGTFFGNGGEITVYLPRGTYHDLVIHNNTGDIDIPDLFSFENVTLETDTGDICYRGKLEDNLTAQVDTGDITLEKVYTVGNITLKTDTGDIRLKDVRCLTLKAETDTGDIRLTKCDAGSIDMETDTGDVTGSLLSEKIFIVKSSTGKVSVPESTKGDKCKIETDTGDVKITIDETDKEETHLEIIEIE